MDIVFDPDKRLKALNERGLDFARADEVFAGPHLTIQDDRRDYGEVRFMTIGLLDRRMVVMIWTHRDPALRIISMRKANDREYAIYSGRLLGH
ncbi:BrnT family toxin [Rhizobium sp. AQ_MP]|nr:BrnT family toxin [Rhizobium sp. AQ_MP]MBC2775385.1 BrnT family toxin [Rhizobium sp. AQ_MP]